MFGVMKGITEECHRDAIPVMLQKIGMSTSDSKQNNFSENKTGFRQIENDTWPLAGIY